MSTEPERLTEVEALQLQLAAQAIALAAAQLTSAQAQAEAARMMVQAHAADAEILRGRLVQAKAAGHAKGQAIRAAHALGTNDTIAEDGTITRAPVEAAPAAQLKSIQ
jgi:hypothetical protein